MIPALFVLKTERQDHLTSLLNLQPCRLATKRRADLNDLAGELDRPEAISARTKAQAIDALLGPVRFVLLTNWYMPWQVRDLHVEALERAYPDTDVCGVLREMEVLCAEEVGGWVGMADDIRRCIARRGVPRVAMTHVLAEAA